MSMSLWPSASASRSASSSTFFARGVNGDLHGDALGARRRAITRRRRRTASASTPSARALRGDALVLAQQSEQEVLGADAVDARAYAPRPCADDDLRVRRR